MRAGGQTEHTRGAQLCIGELGGIRVPRVEPPPDLSPLRKAREKMMDASRSMGNGFSYQEKLSSTKLTSVLEAIAGEYALVINGHSLVGPGGAGLGALPAPALVPDCPHALLAGPRAGGGHGGGVPGDGVCLQGCHLLPCHALAESPGGGAGEEVQEGRDPGHRGRRQRCQHDQE